MRKSKQYVMALAVAAVGGIACAPAVAATATGTFDVKIVITSTCTINTVAATDVDFGSHPSSDTNIDAAGKINVTCTPGTTYMVELDNGQNFSTTRRMKDTGSNYVAYDLYRDAGRTQPWGADPNHYSGTGTGANQPIDVYGRVPSANSAAGSYIDTVTATVTY